LSKLLKNLELNSNFAKGSLNSVCAKCICEVKYSRKAYRLTYKNSQQKTKIVYIPEHKIPEIKKMIANYSKVRKVMEELIEVNLEIFKEKGAC